MIRSRFNNSVVYWSLLVFRVVGTLEYLLAKTKGYSIIQASTSEELGLVQKIRWEVYSESGYIESRGYPNKVLEDDYDRYSTNFLVTWRGMPVGAVRAIIKSPIGYPTEHLFNIPKTRIDFNKIGEASKLTIVKRFRSVMNKKHERLVMWCLAKALYDFARKNGVEYSYAFMAEKLADSLSNFGFRFLKIPEGRLTENNLHARDSMRGYFDKLKPVPYLFQLKVIGENKQLHELFYEDNN